MKRLSLKINEYLYSESVFKTLIKILFALSNIILIYISKYRIFCYQSNHSTWHITSELFSKSTPNEWKFSDSRNDRRLGTDRRPEKPSIPALNHVIVSVNIRLPGCIVLRSSWGKVLIRLPFRVVGLDISESPRRSIVLGPRVALQPFPSLLSSPAVALPPLALVSPPVSL